MNEKFKKFKIENNEKIIDGSVDKKEDELFLNTMVDEEANWIDSQKSYKKTQESRIIKIEEMKEIVGFDNSKIEIRKDDVDFDNYKIAGLLKKLGIDYNSFKELKNNDILKINYDSVDFLDKLPEGFLYKWGS